VSKRETSEKSSTGADPSDAERSQQKLQSQHIRLSDEDWQALEAIAKAERRQTGSAITASGLARQILRREIRRRTGGGGKGIIVV
jgi:hypothetical protein